MYVSMYVYVYIMYVYVFLQLCDSSLGGRGYGHMTYQIDKCINSQ